MAHGAWHSNMAHEPKNNPKNIQCICAPHGAKMAHRHVPSAMYNFFSHPRSHKVVPAPFRSAVLSSHAKMAHAHRAPQIQNASFVVHILASSLHYYGVHFLFRFSCICVNFLLFVVSSSVCGCAFRHVGSLPFPFQALCRFTWDSWRTKMAHAHRATQEWNWDFWPAKMAHAHRSPVEMKDPSFFSRHSSSSYRCDIFGSWSLACTLINYMWLRIREAGTRLHEAVDKYEIDTCVSSCVWCVWSVWCGHRSLQSQELRHTKMAHLQLVSISNMFFCENAIFVFWLSSLLHPNAGMNPLWWYISVVLLVPSMC